MSGTMNKRAILFLTALMPLAGLMPPAHAASKVGATLVQAASGVEAKLTLTSSSCAATAGYATTGVQTSGPCTGQLYRAAATVSGASVTCAAFSTSTYTLLSGTIAMAAPSAVYTDTTITPGNTYCYAATATFTAGGGPGAVSATFPLAAIVAGGTPAQATVTGVVAAVD